MFALSDSLTQGLPQTRFGWRWLPTWPASRAPRVITRTLICAVSWRGAPSASSIRWPRGECIWSCISGGCRRTAGFKPSTVSGRFSVTAGFYRTAVIDDVLEHSPAEHVRRPAVPPESPTLGFTHLQFETMLTASRQSPNEYDFALVVMLGVLGLRIFEATGADIADLGAEHGHRVLRVRGNGSKIVLVPLPPAVGRAIDRAVSNRTSGPILLNTCGARMDRHAATRRLRYLADAAGVCTGRTHPRMLRHTFVTTMLDAGVDLRDVQIAARHADPRTTMRYDRARQNLDRHPN